MTTDYRHEAFPPTAYCSKCHHADGTHEVDCPHKECGHDCDCQACVTHECDDLDAA